MNIFIEADQTLISSYFWQLFTSDSVFLITTYTD